MSNQQESHADIPDGYVAIRSDNGQHYLVPHFMIPATHQVMEAYRKKVELNVRDAYGGVSFPSFQCLWPVPILFPLPCLGRCRALADAVPCPLPCLSADAAHPLTHHQFSVWKHDR
jgi:hypothetical protein